MPNAHVEVSFQNYPSDPPKDYCSHSLYFVGASGADWTALVNTVRDCFFLSTKRFQQYFQRAGTVKAYDMADARPRPIKATATYSPGSTISSGLGPRHNALCLSFYSDRNVKRQRGRIYLGPFMNTYATEAPSATLRGYCIGLGQDLFTLPAALPSAWVHSIHSTMDMDYKAVTNYWVNDVWDVQHRRLGKETTRSKYP